MITGNGKGDSDGLGSHAMEIYWNKSLLRHDVHRGHLSSAHSRDIPVPHRWTNFVERREGCHGSAHEGAMSHDRQNLHAERIMAQNDRPYAIIAVRVIDLECAVAFDPAERAYHKICGLIVVAANQADVSMQPLDDLFRFLYGHQEDH